MPPTTPVSKIRAVLWRPHSSGSGWNDTGGGRGPRKLWLTEVVREELDGTWRGWWAVWGVEAACPAWTWPWPGPTGGLSCLQRSTGRGHWPRVDFPAGLASVGVLPRNRVQGAQPHLATGLFSTGRWSPRPTATVGSGQPHTVSKPESDSGSFGGRCAGGQGPVGRGVFVAASSSACWVRTTHRAVL